MVHGLGIGIGIGIGMYGLFTLGIFMERCMSTILLGRLGRSGMCIYLTDK